MRTKILSEGVLARIRRRPLVYRVLRSGRFAVGRFLPPTTLPGVPGRVHRNDFMLNGTDPDSLAFYISGGRADAELMITSAQLVGHDPAAAKAWLDFGCGYGRVVRFLTEQVSPSAVWVTDVLPGAAEFCARELGVTAVSAPFDGGHRNEFEVIYAISVFSHLPLRAGADLLQQMRGALVPGGAVVFTTHGPSVSGSPGHYGSEFADRAADITATLERDGACYLPYRHSKDGSYGVTWHTEPYLRSAVEDATGGALKVVSVTPRGLGGHQDVYVLKAV